MKKRAKYQNDLPKKMYTYFVSYSDTNGAPSFLKFAKSIGATLEDIELFKKHREFMRSWNACSEIRRDYLIDMALSKRFDSSLTKFILVNEFGMGEETESSDGKDIKVMLEVIDK